MNTTTELPPEDLLPFQDDAMMEIPAINEDFDGKVQEAQEQLLKLRHEQEQLEKQKAQLELLSQQQEKFVSGRTVLTEQLTRTIATLEREAFEAEKRVEFFLHSKDSLARHIEIIESFNPEQWSRDEIRVELSHALGAIEEAETDYNSTISRMSGFVESKSGATTGSSHSVLSAGVSAGHPKGFTASFMNGLAFTLPFMIFSLIGLLLYLLLSV